MATNIATSPPPAHLTTLLKWFAHLQPSNVQPILSQQPTNAYSPLSPIAETSTNTPSARLIKDMVSTPNTSLFLPPVTQDSTNQVPRE